MGHGQVPGEGCTQRGAAVRRKLEEAHREADPGGDGLGHRDHDPHERASPSEPDEGCSQEHTGEVVRRRDHHPAEGGDDATNDYDGLPPDAVRERAHPQVGDGLRDAENRGHHANLSEGSYHQDLLREQRGEPPLDAPDDSGQSLDDEKADRDDGHLIPFHASLQPSDERSPQHGDVD